MSREDFAKQISNYQLPLTDESRMVLTDDLRLLYWTEEGLALFPLTDDGRLGEARPEVIPHTRVTHLHYEKKLIGSDQLTFEVEGQSYHLSLPHRSRAWSEQREELRQLREQLPS